MAGGAHRCGICGADRAPFGYRLPGPLSQLPAGKRGTLWACAAHRDAAAQRQANAISIHRRDATAPKPPLNLTSDTTT